MEKFLLRKSWKNDTFEYIQQAGLNPLGFQWGEEQSDQHTDEYIVPVLKYKGSKFYFKFDLQDDDEFFCKFSPGVYELVEEPLDKYYEWDEVLDQFREWLSCLKKEIALDLWEQLKECAPDETFIGTAEISNAPFSNSEAENIIESLDKLQAQIEENFKLQGEQLAFVKRQIDYLKDAVKRQGRKDWMHTSIGVLVTIATGLALSPEKAKLLWDLARSCFSAILPLPAP